MARSYEARMRPCLGPGAVEDPHEFWSEGPGNRVCDSCEILQRDIHVPRVGAVDPTSGNREIVKRIFERSIQEALA